MIIVWLETQEAVKSLNLLTILSCAGKAWTTDCDRNVFGKLIVNAGVCMFSPCVHGLCPGTVTFFPTAQNMLDRRVG